jgi:hypothetical protein
MVEVSLLRNHYAISPGLYTTTAPYHGEPPLRGASNDSHTEYLWE